MFGSELTTIPGLRPGLLKPNWVTELFRRAGETAKPPPPPRPHRAGDGMISPICGSDRPPGLRAATVCSVARRGRQTRTAGTARTAARMQPRCGQGGVGGLTWTAPA